MAEHRYQATLTWTDERATVDYRGYPRAHEVTAAGCPVLLGSVDRAFRGDATRWNPELLLVAALSECHLLSCLSAYARVGVVVTGYVDSAIQTMAQAGNGGRFREVVLRPRVQVSEAGMVEWARSPHEQTHADCFIAPSLNFPVRHEPRVEVAGGGTV